MANLELGCIQDLSGIVVRVESDDETLTLAVAGNEADAKHKGDVGDPSEQTPAVAGFIVEGSAGDVLVRVELLELGEAPCKTKGSGSYTGDSKYDSDGDGGQHFNTFMPSLLRTPRETINLVCDNLAGWDALHLTCVKSLFSLFDQYQLAPLR